ncbi:synaptonemal complex central element protein 1 isoform X1 [Gadus morhua]|uniref:synaptonemal complex central element protein 1 isoform X1 n=1 Tax=Gadus morhua TaxID=8049 RepID=UPI0011B4ABE4|nr:synaptonemal complex central element protein 1-like isoform X1 [Gadus morhua]
MEELKFEQLMVKLRKHQEEKLVLDGDVAESLSVHDALLEELANLRTEAYQLKATHRDKKESCRVLQFQCRESEQESARQLQLNRQSEETLEQYRCQIQELKLKHRKLRMKFENQLNQLIEQHKNLLTIFTPERLPSEIESAQNSKCQLLATGCGARPGRRCHHVSRELLNKV